MENRIGKSIASVALVCMSMNMNGQNSDALQSKALQAEDGKFLIHGCLNNVEDGTVINLYEASGRMLSVVDSDTLRNGCFSLSDTIAPNTTRKLSISPNGSGFPNALMDVWVKTGADIKVAGCDKLHPLWKVESAVPEQQTENALKRLALNERLQRLQLMVEERRWMEDLSKLYENWPKIDSLRKLQEPLQMAIHTAELEYMDSIPVDAAWIDKYCLYASLLDAYPYMKNQVLSLYPKLSAEFLSTEKGKEITAYLYPCKVVNEGDDMVDGTLYDLDGNVHHLSEFRGQYILLDFWSQGCGPCIMSIPELDELIEDYHDKVAVVSICEDGKERWQKFVRQRQMKGNQWNELVSGRTGLAAAYQVRGIPHYVLISPNGKVLKIWEGYGPGSLRAYFKVFVK